MEAAGVEIASEKLDGPHFLFPIPNKPPPATAENIPQTVKRVVHHVQAGLWLGHVTRPGTRRSRRVPAMDDLCADRPRK